MPEFYNPRQEVQNSPHQILGIASTANPVEIKAAYHNLARKYHPDTEQNPELKKIKEEMMKKINVAYDALSSPNNTPKKEIETASSSDSMDFGGMDFDDILTDLLKKGSRNLELKTLKNTVKKLINAVIGENTNYKEIETEKGIISAEQIRTSLLSITQTIFEGK